jgi:hypothetical protein
MDQSDAYSISSQNTKDNKNLVWKDKILVAAAEKVETFAKIAQPRDLNPLRQSGQFPRVLTLKGNPSLISL